MDLQIKYYYYPILLDSHTVYVCRIVDKNYKEYYNETLSRAEFEIFHLIMESDKYAILYRTHEKFKDLAYMKLEQFCHFPILNGTKYP